MTYTDLIKELHRRSGLGVKEYAEATSISVGQMSNVLNENRAGSYALALRCLEYAGFSIEDCLILPDGEPASRQEQDVIRLFRSLSDDQRGLALKLLKQLAEAARVLRRSPRK